MGATAADVQARWGWRAGRKHPSDDLVAGETGRGVARWLPSVLLLLVCLLAPSLPLQQARIRAIAGPATFNLVEWEVAHVSVRLPRIVAGLSGPPTLQAGDFDAARAYLLAPRQERAAYRAAAEPAIERIVARTLLRNGVGARGRLPGDRLFPPLLTALTPPPNVLITSPRDALVVTQSVLLKSELTAGEKETIENAVDATGVVSLVVPIGGIATYPAMVLESEDPRHLLSSVAHEWIHHYLIFSPLGLGYWTSPETRAINETVADLAGNEIGREVLHDLGLTGTIKPPPSHLAPPPPLFDFRRFMRETRLRVEDLLQAGQIDAAEQYMEERRIELNQRGYRIRKLNQAYFAFYGSYTEGFAGSPRSPIPRLVRALRADSVTLGEFLARVAPLTTVAELERAVADIDLPTS